MNKFNILTFFICLFLTGNVYSAQYEVKMLSSGSGGSMVFEPSVIKIQFFCVMLAALFSSHITGQSDFFYFMTQSIPSDHQPGSITILVKP